MHRIALIVLSAAGLCGVAATRAHASTVDLHWSAPPDCPSRESLRAGLSKRLGREVTFGAAAPLQVWAEIEARGGGYELRLRTRSQTQSDERRLQARSCGELARATLLITSVLLGAAAQDTPAPALGPGERSEEGSASGRDKGASERRSDGAGGSVSPASDGRRGWDVFVRAGANADLGSLAAVSVGPRLVLGLGLGSTRLELAGLYLPSQALAVAAQPGAGASLQLTAASAGICQEFSFGPTLAPCLRIEAGRLRGRGRGLQVERTVDGTWFAAMLGAAFGLRLIDPLFVHAELSGGLPLSRPRFAIAGAGTLHRVPVVIGRFELSLEARF